MDEVGWDVGPDPRARGLLDRWRGEGVTGEQTGSLHEEAEQAQIRMAALAAMVDLADELAARAAEDAPRAPSAAVKSLIADETLDPLPVPDGVQPPAVGGATSETTVEVTAVQALPPRPPTTTEPPTARPEGRASERPTELEGPSRSWVIFGAGVLLVLIASVALLLVGS